METLIFLYLIFLSLLTQPHGSSSNNSSAENEINVGVILNMGSWTGKSINSSISMALSDFYDINSHYKSRIVLHTRDSKGDPMQTISAGLDLLENTKVQAIIGPETYSETKFLAELADKANVPIFTFSALPSSSWKYPFLVQVQQDLLSQLKGITDVLELYQWRTINVIYEDSEDGREIVPYLTNYVHEANIRIAHCTAIALSYSADQILEELHKLDRTTINVVHTSPSVTSRLFPVAKSLGMTREGYAWIFTDKTMNLWHTLDPYVIDSLEGAIGFKAYIPETSKLHDFNLRLRKEFYAQDPKIEPRELDVPGIWAYDTVWALAASVEKIGAEFLNSQNHGAESCYQSPDFTCVAVSQIGTRLLNEIARTRIIGLSGEFEILNRKLHVKSYVIVNVIKQARRVGFWTPMNGIVKEMKPSTVKGLKAVVWPGDSTYVPSERRMKKLRIGVLLSKPGYTELVNVRRDPNTTMSGYSIEIFVAAIQSLPYAVPYEFVPSLGSYDDLIYQVYLKQYDGAIGGITITANRSQYVDFTAPYTDLGVGTIAKREASGMWVFLKPLSTELWLTCGTFFVLMAFVVWIIEHPTNEEFQGSVAKQIGTILWFGFSTLVYAHRERLTSNFSKLVVIVWLFVVLILTSTYTATLSSMLTLKQIQLASAGDRIGTQDFTIHGDVVNSNLDIALKDKKVELYNSTEELADALSRGQKKGGVKAIIDEMPYVKIFLGQYGTDYAMVASASTTGGFGFAFSKGSPLVSDLSHAILKLREDGKLAKLETQWFNRDSQFLRYDDASMPNILNVQNFTGLFLMSCVSFALALLPHLIFKLFKSLQSRNIIIKLFGGGKLAFLLRFLAVRDEEVIELVNVRQ